MTTKSNLAILRGTATDAPVQRALSDCNVAQFDLTTKHDDGARPATTSVPIAWYDPSDAALAPVRKGAQLLVIGMVRRRFFRTGGGIQSRTEVVAERVIPLSRTKTVRQAVSTAITQVVE